MALAPYGISQGILTQTVCTTRTNVTLEWKESKMPLIARVDSRTTLWKLAFVTPNLIL